MRSSPLPRYIRLVCLTVITLTRVDLAAAPPPLVQPVPRAALLALAQKKFGTLSLAEELFFRAAQEGTAASVVTGDAKEDDPANAANWPAGRTIRAACIAWVCTNPQASALVTYRGLLLFGMCIDGELDLVNADIKFQFYAWKCAFSDNISLQDAQTRGFYLLECTINSLNADRAVINGSVLMRQVRAEGEVNFLSAKISGDLDCDGAQFLNSDAKGLALNADGAKIEGRVLLRNGFKAEGEVKLLGTTISGDLDCGGGQFSNARGPALTGDSAKVKGGVYLRRGFKAQGEVNLVGAIIDGVLDCGGGQFSNAQGLALTGDSAEIKGGVYLRNGFKAEGEVNLWGATIGGGVDCSGGQFSNPEGVALNANGAKIRGGVFLREGFETGGEVTCFEAEGAVDLVETTIGGNLDCEGGRFSNAKDLALNANAANIEGGVYLRDGFEAEGEVNLMAATIGFLQIRGVIEASRAIFNMRLAKVGTFWDDKTSWPKAGNLFLDGFRYERLYEKAPFEADSRKEWLSLQPQHKSWPQPYEQLASVLRQMGHEREARQVMIEKNRERARFTHFPQQSWWWYNFFGPVIGYGYEPWRAFAASLVMIVFGAYFFRDGFTLGLVEPTEENAYAKTPEGKVIEENGQKNISETYPAFNAFVYSLESFLPLIKFDQSGNWRPSANRGRKISLLPFWSPCTGSLVRGYLYFHIASGWLLTSLWVGAVTGLAKT